MPTRSYRNNGLIWAAIGLFLACAVCVLFFPNRVAEVLAVISFTLAAALQVIWTMRQRGK